MCKCLGGCCTARDQCESVCKHILKFNSLPAGLTSGAHVLMESQHVEIQTHWEQVTVTRCKYRIPPFSAA